MEHSREQSKNLHCYTPLRVVLTKNHCYSDIFRMESSTLDAKMFRNRCKTIYRKFRNRCKIVQRFKFCICSGTFPLSYLTPHTTVPCRTSGA